MPTTATQADIAYNDELWIGRWDAVDSEYDWYQILGIEALPFPSKPPEEVDATHMQSPGRSRETIPGLLAVADYSVEKQYWPESDGDILLEELAALTEAGTKENVLVEFRIDGTGGARRTYSCYVNEYTPQPSIGEKRMATLGLKISAREATNPRVISGS